MAVLAPTTERSARLATWGAVAAYATLSALYLAVVVHYSVDELFTDEWDVVPMVHAALHGQLTLSALWAQHGENRMLVPNVGFVALGVATHDNPRADVALSWVVNIASFGVFLALCRSSLLRRPLTAPFVLAVGVVWFGLEDWENALFGFQFAWWLIVFFLVLMLWLLLVSKWAMAFPLAVACGFAASFSSFQGLALWPVGLLCLLWIGARRRHLAWWVGATAVALGLYFWHYTSRPTGFGVNYVFFGINTASVSPTYALRHPVEFGHFILVLLGKVVPTESLALSTLIGAVVLIATVAVVVGSVHERSSCVPVALIAFGLLFDLFIAAGRIPVGVPAATESRYTMPNVLILVAIVAYGYVHVRANWVRTSGVVVLAGLFGLTIASGLNSASSFNRTLQTGARLVVNRDQVPASTRHCFAVWGFFLDVNVVPVTQSWLFDEAQADHLGAFGAPYRTYRAEGLPRLHQCT